LQDIEKNKKEPLKKKVVNNENKKVATNKKI